MLDSLRKFGSSWFGKIVVGFLLIGLAGFGISGVLAGLTSTTVAKVGRKDISINEFLRAYNNQLNAVAQQIGTVPTPDQAMLFGIPGTVINRLADETALTAFSEKLGVGASNDQLRQLLEQDPTFAGTLGNFDPENFRRVLRQLGVTESEYVRILKETAQRQQFVLATFGGVTAPQTGLEMVNRYQNDTRTVEFFTLSPAAALPPADPTEEELQTYLDENQAQFRTVPTRQADFIVLTPATLAANLEITETDILNEYERSQASLFKIETRDVSQLVLSSDEQKAAFEAGLTSDANISDLITEFALEPTSLGTLTKASIADATMADAAFDLEEGKYALIPGALGTRAIFVENIVPGGQLTLEEARDQLDSKLRNAQGRTKFIEVLDEIEELRAAFRPLEEIASRYDLDLTTVSLSANGSALSAIAEIPQDAQARVASAVFNQEMGALAPTVSLGTNLNVWFDLKSIEDSRDQTLDEVKDVISQTILDGLIDADLQDTATKAVEALDEGTDLQTLAAGQGLFAELSTPITRQGGGVITPQIANDIFNGGSDHHGFAKAQNGDYLIYQVTEVTPADISQAEQSKPLLDQALRDDLFNEFSAVLRNDAGVSVSQQVLQQAIGVNAGATTHN